MQFFDNATQKSANSSNCKTAKLKLRQTTDNRTEFSLLSITKMIFVGQNIGAKNSTENASEMKSNESDKLRGKNLQYLRATSSKML